MQTINSYFWELEIKNKNIKMLEENICFKNVKSWFWQERFNLLSFLLRLRLLVTFLMNIIKN